MRLKTLACIFAATCLFAGCMDQGPIPRDATDAQTNGPEPGNGAEWGNLARAVGWLNQTFTIVQTGMGPAQVDGSNCAQFDRDDLRRIQSGWVNVSWTTSSPASQQMRLSVLHDAPNIEVAGGSPLSLKLDDVESNEVHGLWMYLRTDAAAGVDVEVDMQLHWALTYEGKAPLEFADFTCG